MATGSNQSINQKQRAPVHCAECGLEFTSHGQHMTARAGQICKDGAACAERKAQACVLGHCATCGQEFWRIAEYSYVLDEIVCRDNEVCAEQSLLRQRERCAVCGGGVR